MKKMTQDERISILEGRVAVLTDMIATLNHRIEALEKPRALTKQEILDAGGVISLGGR